MIMLANKGLRQDTTLEDQWLLQKEKVLAWVRLGFSAAAILVLQLNPQRAATFPVISQISLYCFLLYSLFLLYLVKTKRLDLRKTGVISTCLDLLWISLMVFSTGGSRTPFFVYFLFPVITASSRYGVAGSLLLALVSVILYGVIRFSYPWETPLGIDIFIIRSSYLFVLAYIFGFLSEFEKKQNQRLMAHNKTAGEAARQDERRRIAHELHDRLLQVLASLTLRLETCRKHLVGSPEELGRELELMEEASRSSIAEIRQFLAGKDPRSWVPGTLVEMLRQEMSFLRDGLGMKVLFECEPEDLYLSPEIEQEIYYVLREGLMNVARHSHASKVEIRLSESNHEIHGSLQDDGIGFNRPATTNGGRYGLITMEERLNKIGGALYLESFVGKGTRVAFKAPLAPPAHPG